MKKERAQLIKGINEIGSATSGIIALINPIFVGMPLMVFAINRVIDLVSDDDIILRINKIEKKLEQGKISLEDFKNKVNNLSEHKKYFAADTLENVLKKCIPETLDIYIKSFINYIMKEKIEMDEIICEIIKQLNANDYLLLVMIKDFLHNGEKNTYTKENQTKNNLIQEKNNSKLMQFEDRNIIFDNQTTIFWEDFTNFNNVSNIPLNFFLLENGYDEEGNPSLIWAYLGRSLIKLETLGLVEIDHYTTLGTLSHLNVSRFHITVFGKKILEYIDDSQEIKL